VCGYPPRDLVERPSFAARNRETAEEIAVCDPRIAVICGLVTPAESETGKSAMNSAALLQEGKIAFLQSKMLLPTYDVFDEMRNFAPAKSQQLFPLWRQSHGAYDLCEEPGTTSYSGRSGCTRLIHRRADSSRGDLVLNISASPFWIGKREVRRDHAGLNRPAA